MSLSKDLLHKMVELPTTDEIKEWIGKDFAHLNPDFSSFFFMGVEALYTKLGGERFLYIKMPGETQNERI